MMITIIIIIIKHKVKLILTKVHESKFVRIEKKSNDNKFCSSTNTVCR